MKTSIAFLIGIVSVGSAIGFVEPGIFEDIASYFRIGASKGSGKISFPVIIILLATGIIGVLGIRRRGKKS